MEFPVHWNLKPKHSPLKAYILLRKYYFSYRSMKFICFLHIFPHYNKACNPLFINFARNYSQINKIHYKNNGISK